jgi:hypothetical protein
MNTIQTPAPPGLLLHCGAEIASRQDISDVQTPGPTETWFPLPHLDLIQEIEGLLDGAGFVVEAAAHSLSHHGARYFGVIQVGLPGDHERDYSWIVGLRNSHDKSYPAGLVAGTRVLVCDNLAFGGEVKLSRKHTRFATRDLKHLAARAVGQLGDRFHEFDRRIDAYRARSVSDSAAHDLIVRAIDCRAITATQLPKVVEEWRKPRFPDFEPRTAWSLFNAFTEIHKRTNPHTAVARTQALHGLFDSLAGLN